MILPGHLSGGYLTTRGILTAAAALIGVNGHLPLSPNELIALTIVGILSGDFPDIDVAFFYLSQISKKKSPGPEKDSHRGYITHIPLFWLILGLAIAGAGWLVGSLFVIILGFIFWLGPWSHFLFDSIEYGIRWFAPFSNKRFALLPGVEFESKHTKGGLSYYYELVVTKLWKRPQTMAELVITGLAVWVAFH